MNTTIGKKIREFRKELKMTQSDLAGTEMTKSMLSHIETGHSNPSMKNLEYIARKLNKPIAYLLEEDTVDYSEHKKEKQLPMDKILPVLKYIDELIKRKSYVLAQEETNKLISAYDFDENSKIYADVVYRLGCSKLKLKDFQEGEKSINQCCKIYFSNMLYVEAARATMDLLRVELENYEYNSCLNIIDQVYKIYGKSSSRDIFLEIEMLVMQPAVYFALGEYEKTIDVCKRAILLSRDNNIYYRLDDAYRILSITYMLQGDFNNFHINANEAKKYVEFTGNKLNLAKIYHNYAKYENAKGNPLEAVRYLELLVDNAGEKTFYYYLEHGKAQYLMGNYNESLEELMKITPSEKPGYLMDCIYMLTSKIYKGLIYSKLGDFNNAVTEIEKGINDIEVYTSIEYKGFVMYAYNELAFAYGSLSEVYSLKGDYEKAYILLKKSYEVKQLQKNK
jgi:transcriptional regulator with XRE-family HTH domain